MSVRLCKIRPGQGAAWTSPRVEAPSLKALFLGIDKYLEKIPPADRYDLFYTLGDFGRAESVRPRAGVQSLDVVPIDFDDCDFARLDEYVEAVAQVFQIPENFTVVCSGKGLHFLIFAEKPFSSSDIKDLQPHWKEVMRKLIELCTARGLPMKMGKDGKNSIDMIFDGGRIFRLPGTENRKRAPEISLCKFLQVDCTPHALDLRALSGLPEVDPSDEISPSEARKVFRDPDTEGVLDGCTFLKWTKDKPLEVKEPQAYAAVSILARLNDGKRLAADAIASWSGSRSVSGWDAQTKIDQTLTTAGPRTCKNIDLHYGECRACPHYGKVVSPIAIQRPDFIPTEGSGFYNVIHDGGKIKRVPAYHDLWRAFTKDKHYHHQAQAKILWGYKGTHYAEFSESEVKAYSEDRMEPKPTEAFRAEFLSKVKANRLRSQLDMAHFFESTTEGKLNLANGVFDLATRALTPHSPDYGFRYVLPYAFDPTATAPRFEAFLSEITLGRQIFQDVLLDALAACLVPGYETFDAGFWWFQGTGRNGKSKFLDLARSLIGNANTVAMDAPSLEGDSGRFRMAELDGKLLCVLEETNERMMGARLMGVIKNISGGGMVPVERKNGHPYQMKSTAKLFFSANAAPILEDTTAAVKRRFIPVPFDLNLMDPKCPVARDPHLLKKLTAELPGVFNLVLKALVKLMARGEFLNPGESKGIMAQIARDSDSVEAWIHERTDLCGDGVRLKFGEAYDDYVRFVQENPVTRKTFAARLKNKLGKQGETSKFRFGSEVLASFAGLRLKGRNDDNPGVC